MQGDAMVEAFKIMAERVKEISEALKPIYEINRPANNRPHDPSLLKDKRKWGGK